MKVNILGTPRKGKKSFRLIAGQTESYRIEALSTDNRTTHFKDIVSIDWMFSGESVLLKYADGKEENISFYYKFYTVKIIKAGRVCNSETLTINLTQKEVDDIKRGLIIAMQTLDSTKNNEDILLADRIDIINGKFDEITEI